MESGLWKLRQNGPTFFQVLIRALAPKSKGQNTRLPWTGLSPNYWRNTDVNPTWECKGLNREVAPKAGSGEPECVCVGGAPEAGGRRFPEAQVWGKFPGHPGPGVCLGA